MCCPLLDTRTTAAQQPLTVSNRSHFSSTHHFLESSDHVLLCFSELPVWTTNDTTPCEDQRLYSSCGNHGYRTIPGCFSANISTNKTYLLLTMSVGDVSTQFYTFLYKKSACARAHLYSSVYLKRQSAFYAVSGDNDEMASG